MSIYTSIRQNAIGLGLFAILTAGVIALTQTMTSERIAENERHYQAKLLYEILPTADADLALLPQQLSQELFGDLALLGVKDGTAYFIDRSTQDVILPAIAISGLKFLAVSLNTRFPWVSPFHAFTMAKSALKAYSIR